MLATWKQFTGAEQEKHEHEEANKWEGLSGKSLAYIKWNPPSAHPRSVNYDSVEVKV